MKIFVPWIWIRVGLFVVIEIGLLYLYHLEGERDRATILFLATIVAGAFGFFSYLHAIEEKRLVAASHLIERWNSPELYPWRKILKEVTDEKLDPEVLMRKFKGEVQDPDILEKRYAISSLLNFFEEMAISVAERSADEEKLNRFFGQIVNQVYTRLEGFIANERKIDNANRYYIDFQKLTDRWRRRR
jgi:hypothetical protein